MTATGGGRNGDESLKFRYKTAVGGRRRTYRSDLQNRCGAVIPSRVGSTPMHSRPIRLVMFLGRPVPYVFFGRDSFSRRERLDGLSESLDADGMLASSATVLDGRKISLVEVRAACDTVPLMSANRLEIVEGLLSRLAGAAADPAPYRQSR